MFHPLTLALICGVSQNSTILTSVSHYFYMSGLVWTQVAQNGTSHAHLFPKKLFEFFSHNTGCSALGVAIDHWIFSIATQPFLYLTPQPSNKQHSTWSYYGVRGKMARRKFQKSHVRIRYLFTGAQHPMCTISMWNTIEHQHHPGISICGILCQILVPING